METFETNFEKPKKIEWSPLLVGIAIGFILSLIPLYFFLAYQLSIPTQDGKRVPINQALIGLYNNQQIILNAINQ